MKTSDQAINRICLFDTVGGMLAAVSMDNPPLARFRLNQVLAAFETWVKPLEAGYLAGADVVAQAGDPPTRSPAGGETPEVL